MVIFFLFMLAGMAGITYICFKDIIVEKGGLKSVLFKKAQPPTSPKVQ